jgi:hypothetical protein
LGGANSSTSNDGPMVAAEAKTRRKKITIGVATEQMVPICGQGLHSAILTIASR